MQYHLGTAVSSQAYVNQGDDYITAGAATSSTLSGGAGNDSITGSSETGVGIYVGAEGEIKAGAGNDTVDALIGGFAGSSSGGGTISLGADNDTLIGDGFGSGITFDGDGFLGEGEVAGTEDKIVLDDGFYAYTPIGESATLTDGSGIMEIKNFELISGINGTINQFDNESQTGEADLVSGNYEVVNGFLKVEVSVQGAALRRGFFSD